MVRWQPHAPERLVAAALDLFEERGYDDTTVIAIAERAGLTKSTFFRHFADKREVLFGGSGLSDLLVQGIATAEDGATALEVIAHAFEGAGSTVFTQDRRAFNARRAAIIAGAPELQEREALKQLGLVASMIEALRERGVPEPAASVAAELGAVAFRIALVRWSEATAGDDFTDAVRATLGEVRAVASSF